MSTTGGVHVAAGSLLLAVCAIAILNSSAGAKLESIRVSPGAPSNADTILVEIDGLLYDSCWTLADVSCGSPEGDTLSISITDAYSDSLLCIPDPRPYHAQCAYAPLPEGTYHLIVTETEECPRFTRVWIFKTDFEVRSIVPARVVHWGRIRALYR